MMLLALVVTPPATLGCAGEELGPAPCYEAPATMGTAELCDMLAGACEPASGGLPALGEMVQVVPDAAAMPAGVVSQRSHNNLDVAWHQGRLYFAFRTAPNHFASPEVYLYVVSTTDQEEWVLETSITLGKDLREPRFLSVGGALFLYFARLGEVPLTFKPEAMMMVKQEAGCRWSAPRDLDAVGAADFVPWRTRTIDGVGYLIGYHGGEDIYELTDAGIQVHWLKTHDGVHFEPVAGDGVVLEGGASETDFAFMADGSVVAVSRNETGDELGFGSKICTAPAGALDQWTCEPDTKKYDSPLLFGHGEDVYLIGRRQVANDGNFDLGHGDQPMSDQLVEYQLEYWSTPKRCSLWKVQPATRTVEFVLDLPSNGDTCFASALRLNDSQYLVYNYTSPLDDLELSWRDGQFGDTVIYRTTLTLP